MKSDQEESLESLSGRTKETKKPQAASCKPQAARKEITNKVEHNKKTACSTKIRHAS